MVVLVGGLVQGCTGGGKDTKSGPCDFQFGTGGPVAQFHTDEACAPNPWPSDRLLVSGRVTVPESRISYALPDGEAFDAAREYLQQTADTLDADGWSTIAPIHVVLDSEPDLATVQDGVALFRFDAGAPVADATVLEPRWDADLSALVLQPLTPLREATTYGVIVTADLLDASQRPTARSRQFQEYLAAEPIANDLVLYEDSGVQTDRIAVAFTFTTAANTGEMVAIRDRVFAAPDGTHAPAYESPSSFPDLAEGWFPVATDSAGFLAAGGATLGTANELAGIAVGSFDAWDFRGTDLGAFDAALVDGTATPPVNRLDFRLTIPEGPTPPGGWPVVIYAHGLGGSNESVISTGNALAAYGFAAIGISALHHGYRGTVPEFFDWNSMPATREHFRQTYADHLQLLRMLQEGAGDALAPFDQLDTANVSYFGVSLGGIMGSSFLSLAPDNVTGLLVVPGAHLSRELYAQSVAGQYLYPFISNRADIDPVDAEFPLFLKGFEMLVQVGLDRADPVNYAARVVTPGTQFPGSSPKRVLQTISTGDGWVPNDSNYALQRALGIPTLDQETIDGAGVSGAWIFDASDFPEVAGEEPHGYFGLLCEARHMAFHWLESGGTEVLDPTTLTCP